MLKSKKLVSLLLAVAIIMSCGTICSFAADYPSYLNDGITYYLHDVTRGSSIPANSNVLMIPEQTGSFSYSFSGQTMQFSDFIICPTTSTTSIKISYTSTSGSHNMLMEVIEKGSDEIIHSETLYPLNGYQQYLYIDFTSLVRGHGYYIKLTNPSSSTASGTFTISS